MSGQQTLQADEFKRHLRDSLERETRNSRAIKIARHDNVYTAGEPSETIYFIESGQIKLVIFSTEGREGLLSHPQRGRYLRRNVSNRHRPANRHRHGDESDDAETGVLLPIPAVFTPQFVDRGLRALPGGAYCRPTARIANLVTVDSEKRLAQTLLRLAHNIGKKDLNNIRIELRISQAELSQMVGTTRPRISLFMQRFQNLGLIETNKDHFFIIKEKKLTDYVGQIQ